MQEMLTEKMKSMFLFKEIGTPILIREVLEISQIVTGIGLDHMEQERSVTQWPNISKLQKGVSLGKTNMPI